MPTPNNKPSFSFQPVSTKKLAPAPAASSSSEQPILGSTPSVPLTSTGTGVGQPLYIGLVFLFLIQLVIACFPASDVWAGYIAPISAPASPQSQSQSSALAPNPTGTSQVAASAASQSTLTGSDAKTAYGKLPLRFEANTGQVANSTVKYLARGRGYNIFFTEERAILDLRQNSAPDKGYSDTPSCSDKGQGQGQAKKCELAGSRKSGNGNGSDKQTTTKAGLALGLTLVGAKPSQSWKVEAEEELAAKSNYFSGNQAASWKTGLANYSRLAYQNVYKDINLIYYGTEDGRLEYDFVVAPGGNPDEIKVKLDGVASLTRAPDNTGDLVVTTGLGTSPIRQLRPQVYQLAPDGTRQTVGGSYVVRGQTEFGFQVGKYDTSRPLVIDPVLSYATYLGGAEVEEAVDVAVDPSGYIYLLGETTATDFPTTSGAYQTTPADGREIFVTKINSTTNQLSYSTYLRSTSSGDDEASAIRVNSIGQAYIAGSTTSTSFPTTSGAYQTTSGTNTGRNAFVTVLSASGNSLIYSTYLAGSGDDTARALALYPSGTATPTVYVVGQTASSNFPTTSSTYQSANRGGTDGFFVKINPQASGTSSLVYGTYLGGTGYDELTGVAVVTTTARTGQAVLVGTSYSTNFTTTTSAFQPALQNAAGGASDAVIALLDPSVSGATALKYASYYGGDGTEEATATVADVNGKLYLYGTTTSSNLTTTTGVVQRQLRGSQDTFAIKVDPDASGSSSLAYATYLGGTSTEGSATGVSVGPAGSLTIAGWTASTNLTTTSGAYQTTTGGGVDGFISILNPTATSLNYSTYLGGSGTDAIGSATALGSVFFVAGRTLSTNFPVKGGGIQATLNGGTDAFVSALAAGGAGSTDLKYSTYLGGSNIEESLSLAVDAGGAAYIAGQTYSTDFPTTTGSYRELAVGGGDAFVTKLSPDGSTALFSTYLGGTGQDLAKAITIDSAGNVYLAGQTKSTDFPISTTLQTTNRGDFDIFATKLNPSGNAILYSTYLGGSAADNVVRQLVLDTSGRLYLAGTTVSTNYYSTTLLGSAPVSGTEKGLLTVLNPTGTVISYSLVIGGSSSDSFRAIGLDSTGKVYLAGQLVSSNFPAVGGGTIGANGQHDVLLLKVNPAVNGSGTLLYAGAVGGVGIDIPTWLALDESTSPPQVYLTGFTNSNDFPTTTGAPQTAPRTSGRTDNDAFVIKHNFSSSPGSSGLLYSTYLGGSGTDEGYGIALATSGQDVFVTGNTASSNFITTTGAYQPALKGGQDGFIARLKSTGGSANLAVNYSTYFGGSLHDDLRSMALITPSLTLFGVGHTYSQDFPATAAVLQTSLAGGRDAFAARFNLSKLVFTSQPATTTLANAPFSPTVKVAVQNLDGTTNTSYTGLISLTLGVGASSALTGTLTRPAVSGVADFSDISVTISGTGYVLRAASPLLDAVDSTPFTVTSASSGAPGQVSSYSGSPQSTVVSTAFTLPLQVLVKDVYGNPVSGAVVTFTAPVPVTGSQVITGSDGIGRIPSAVFSTTGVLTTVVTATSAVGGIATAPPVYANLLYGSYQVTATVSGVVTPALFSLTNLDVPAAPAGLTATPGDSQVALVWQSPVFTGGAAISGYNLYRLNASNSPVKLNSVPLTLTTYTDTGLANDTEYFYLVTALNSVGESTYSFMERATPQSGVLLPLPPVLLFALGRDSRVELVWQPAALISGSLPVTSTTGYQIYRQTGSGAPSLLTTVASSPLTYTDTTVTNGTTYTYTVVAVSSSGNSKPSNPLAVLANPEPQVPGAPNLTGAVASISGVSLSWNASIAPSYGPVQGYRVYQLDSDNVAQAVVTLSASTTSYQHSTVLTPGMDYFYLVTAYNQYGESYYSRLGRVQLAPGIGGGGPVPETPSSIITTAGKVAQPTLISGTISPRRVAIVRGQVFNRSNQPLAGVSVTVMGRPSYGYTTTDTTGWYTLVVNGGEQLTLNYEKAGYLPSQRQTTLDWQSYEVVRDVVLVTEDTTYTTVSLNSGTGQMSAARSSVISDERGIRQATLLFSPTLSVSFRLADGTSVPYTGTSFTVRATEYTVGATGPAAMPGDLPATSGYTYAAEFSVDEAKAPGAVGVEFSEPVASYTDNFIGFPVGTKIPVAYYDRLKGQWIPQTDGIVVQIVGTSGGKAVLSRDPSGTALTTSELAELGISEAELKSLYSLNYTVGTSLWRVVTTHFSPHDYNLRGVSPIGGPSPDNVDLTDEDLCRICEEKLKLLTSVAQETGLGIPPGLGLGFSQDNSLDSFNFPGETANPGRMPAYSTSQPLSGTDFLLNYRQDWLPTYRPNSRVTISVTNNALYDRLQNIEISVVVAGRKFTQTFPASTAVSYTLNWDGKDAFGNLLQGDQKAKIEVGNVYNGLYVLPPNLIPASFGINSGMPITVGAGPRVTLAKNFEVKLGTWDTRSMGLGGWTVNKVHFYDPQNQVLYEGSGKRRTATYASNVVQTAGSNGAGTYLQMVGAGDGSFYLAGGSSVEQFWPLTNTKVSIAGRAFYGASVTPTVGGPALGVNFGTDIRLALSPDNTNLYLLATNSCTGLWRLNLAESKVYPVITGNCGATEEGGSGQALPRQNSSLGLFSSQTTGDNGLAVSATLTATAVAAGPDGSVYLADSVNYRIRRIGPDGIINTIAGNGDFYKYYLSGASEVYTGDNGSALDAPLPERILSMAVGSDGSLYFVGGYYDAGGTLGTHIRRILPSGIITTVAGIAYKDGDYNNYPTEATLAATLAKDARFRSITAIVAGKDESLYIADYVLGHIYLINKAGEIKRIAGNFYNSNTNLDISALDGTPALEARIYPFSMGVDPQGVVYLVDNAHPDGIGIRQISPVLPGFTDQDLVIKSSDGKELYQFNKYGQHLATTDISGTLLYTIQYQSDGRLASIKNATGTVLLQSTLNSTGDLVTLSNPSGVLTGISLNPNQYDADLGGLVLSANSVNSAQSNPGDPFLGSIGNGKTRSFGQIRQLFDTETAEESASDPNAFPNQPITSTVLGGCGGGDVRGTHFYDLAPDFEQLGCQRLNTSTRNYVAGAVDLALASPSGVEDELNLSFARYYNSLDVLTKTSNSEFPTTRKLGKSGWRHSLQWEMEFSAPVITLTLPSGRQDVFTETGTTVYESPRLTSSILEKVGSDYTLTTLDRTVYKFNDKGVLQTVTDQNGNRVKLEYTSKRLTLAYLCLPPNSDCTVGNASQKLVLTYNGEFVTGVTDHLSRTVGYSYTNDLLTSVTDPEGRVTNLSYEEVEGSETQLLGAVTAPGGQLITRLHYDLDGRFNSAEDANGRRTAAYYDSLVVTSPLKITIVLNQLNGGKFSYCWDNLYRTIGYKDATGGISTYIYNAKSQLTTASDPNKHKTTYTYYPSGLLNTVSDPLSNTTTFDYNSANRLAKVTNPRVKTVGYGYGNGDSNPPTVYTDTEGLVTNLSYAAGTARITQLTRPNGLVVSYEYDNRGYPLKRTETFQTATNLSNPQASLSEVSYITNYSYDPSGKLLFVSDKNSTTTGLTYTYDKSDRLLDVTNQLGQKATYTYNPVGTLASVTNFLGQKATYEYDAVNHLTRSTQVVLPSNIVNVYSYKGDEVFDQTDPNGVHTAYSYDLMGRLVRSSQPLKAGGSATLFYEYDPAGNLRKETGFNSPQNQVTEYTYDEANRLKQVKDASGYFTYNEYDENGNLTKVERDISGSRKLVVTSGYDDSDRPTHQTLANFNPEGGTTQNLVATYAYNTTTNFSSITDPAGRVTSIYRDGLGRTYKTIIEPASPNPLALPQISYAVYNEFDKPVRTINPEGYWQDFEYDALQRPVQVKNYTGKAGSGVALISKTSYKDEVFPVVKTVEPGPASTELSQHYDQAGRLRYARNESFPGLLTTGYNYDPNGNLTSLSDPKGQKIDYEYETTGWLTKVSQGATVRNADTNATSFATIVTQYGYDRLGRRTSVNPGAGQPTTYEYDALGQLTKEKDAFNHTRTRTYDGLGRVVAATDSEGREENYVYDDASHLVKRTTTQSGQPSLVTGFINNALGQPTLMQDIPPSGDPLNTTFQYDGLGRLISVTNSSGVITYGYNRLNQRTALKHYTLLPQSGQPDQISARLVKYSYDGLGRLTDLVPEAPEGANCISYHYEYAGLLLSNIQYPCYENGGLAQADFSYDKAGRLIELTHHKSGQAPFYAVSYQLDKSGNRTWSSESVQPAAPFEGSRNVEFTYDELGRLNRAEEKRGSSASPNLTVYAYNYQYDGAGNRIASTRWQKLLENNFYLWEKSSYQYDSANRLTSQVNLSNYAILPITTTTQYSYDTTNNLTGEAIQSVSKASGALVTTTSSVSYQYDVRNRLSQWKSNPTTQTELVNTYSYDGLDTRLQLSSSQTGLSSDYNYSISYLQDMAGGLPVVLREKYLPDGSQRGYLYAPGTTTPLQEEVYGSFQVSYNHQDGLGSVRVRMSEQGQLVAQNLYSEPFGNSGSGSRATNTANTTATNFRLGGEQQDGASGLYYNRARYYSPATGRFTQQDSYGGDAFDQASLNRYAYANNNPTNLTDPSGHCPWCVGIAVGAGVSYLFQVGVNALQHKANPWTDDISWGAVIAGGVSGGVGGIAFNAVNASWRAAAFVGAVDGVVTGRVAKVADNVFARKDPLDNFLEWNIASDALFGGVIGGGIIGFGNLFRPRYLTIVEYQPELALHRKAWQVYKNNTRFWEVAETVRRFRPIKSTAREIDAFVMNINRRFDENLPPSLNSSVYLAMEGRRVRGAMHINPDSELPDPPFLPLESTYLNLLDSMGGRRGVGTQLLKSLIENSPHGIVHLSAVPSAVSFYQRFPHQQSGSTFVFWSNMQE